MEGIVTVVDTYDDETEAIKDMHRMARKLKRDGQATRYGVFVEKRAGVWYLCLRIRGGSN